MDSVATKPVAGANDMTKFLSIIDKNDVKILNEEKSPHGVTLPVQMAMQHYQAVQEPVHKPVGRDSIIKKYFHEAELDIQEQQIEKKTLMRQYASVIAERVLMKENKLDERSTTEKQARTMAAAAHNPEFAKKVGIKQSVAKEFNQKDKGTALLSNAMKGKKKVKENEILGHSMGFTGGVGPGLQSNVAETPLDLDRDNPMASTIHSHQGANPGSIEYRIMRARRQLHDLAEQAESDSPLVWQHIARLFPELAMNIEQINHGLGELKNIRSKGGVNSKNIPHLESVLPAIKPTKPKAIKPKAKTSVCKAGQVQTGMQIKDGKSVPKCSVTKK